MAPLLLVMITGFLGSFHCAAMCGPFVGYYSMGGGQKGVRHLAYHAGRLTAYLGLGAIAGLLGQTVFFAGAAVGIQKSLMVAMGIAMILVAATYYLPAKAPGRNLLRRLSAWVRGMLGQVNGTERAALMGLLTTLLPCGFLYAYAFAAVATGSPFKGMLTMGAFWLGTAPSLLGVGLAGNLLSGRLPARLQKLTPIFLMVLGLLAITGKWTALPGGPEAASCFGTH